MTVVGLRNQSFTTSDGNKIDGIRIYVEYEDSNVQGKATDSFFLTPRKFVNGNVPVLGDDIKIFYNRYGKVESCEIIGY